MSKLVSPFPDRSITSVIRHGTDEEKAVLKAWLRSFMDLTVLREVPIPAEQLARLEQEKPEGQQTDNGDQLPPNTNQ